MPSLVAFGRRWNIASDDFVFPELTEALVRIAWHVSRFGIYIILVILSVVIFLLHELFKCASFEWLAYTAVMIAINLISAALALLLMAHSARGSLLDVNARRHVVTIIYIRLPLFVAEIVWTITSTFLSFGKLHADVCVSMQAFRIAVLLEWILILTVAFGVFIVFNPHGHSREELFLLEHRSWRQKLMLCKVCQDNEMRAAIDDIAVLLASFFADNDYVLSDVVAGLLLLVHSPHIRAPVVATSRAAAAAGRAPAWMRVPECLPRVCRMFDLAVAIYGWPTYVYNNCACCGCVSCFRLLRRSQLRSLDNVIVLDNKCTCHTSAFLLEAKCAEADLFMVCFRNRLFQTPFIVLADHQSRSIVVAIRGSASLADLVTDLSLNDELFSVDVDKDPLLREDATLDDASGNEVRVHRGMLRAARYVYDKLVEFNVLDEATSRYPDYDLVICGHSLGAGIATLLALLLKQTRPGVQCYAFSPPGCVISRNGVPETEQHALSVFVGDDVIPRISVQSLQLLKANIDREICSTNRAKFEILIKGIFKLFFASPWHLRDNESLEHNNFARDRRSLIDSHEGYGAAATVERLGEPRRSTSTASNNPLRDERRVRLYPPGRLLCVQYKASEHVRLNWVDVEYLSEIQLTSAMFSDHWPKRMRKALQQACNETPVTV